MFSINTKTKTHELQKRLWHRIGNANSLKFREIFVGRGHRLFIIKIEYIQA